MRREQGFSLIELLVVIAIIGLLSAIVLASLNTARVKGVDTAMKNEISQLRPAAELIYSTTNTYDTVCVSSSNTGKIFSSAVSKGDRTPGSALCVGSSFSYLYVDASGLVASQIKTATPDQWASSVQLKNGNFYCVDYKGNARTAAALTISTTDLDCN